MLSITMGSIALAYPVTHFLLQATIEGYGSNPVECNVSLNPEPKLHLSPSVTSSPLPSS